MTGAVVIFCTEGGCQQELCTADILVNSEKTTLNTTLPNISASLLFSFYHYLLQNYICGKPVYMTVLYCVTRNCLPLYYLMHLCCKAYLSFLHLFIICSGKMHRKCVCPMPAKVRTQLKICCAN